MTSGLGRLRERVAFEIRADIDDGMGNPQSQDYVEAYQCAAQITPKLGSETVLAARLSGTQPMLFTVRMCAALRSISTDWRIRDLRTAIVYNIRAISNPDEQKQYLELLAVSGVAT